MTRSLPACLLGLFLTAAAFAGDDAFAGAAVVAGDAEPLSIAHRVVLASKVLAEERPILIHLPAGYEDGTARYPVLYLLDGAQNMMHVAGTVEVLSRTGQIPQLIVVGIVSTDRERDLTASPMPGFDGSGGGPALLDFIARELIPHIDAAYRTHPFRILEGHSLGGALAVHALLHRPGLFDAFIVTAPSLWWNDEELIGHARALLDPKVDTVAASLFLSIGEDDGWGMRQELGRFTEVLEAKAPPTLRWQHSELAGEGHMSAPLLGNLRGLKMVFGDLQLPSDLLASYADAAFLRHEARIAAKYGTAAGQSAETYVRLGLDLLRAERHAEAVTVFRRAAEVYRRYPPHFAWLAEAQEKSGDLAGAMASWEEALRLSESVDVGKRDAYRAAIARLRARMASGG